MMTPWLAIWGARSLDGGYSKALALAWNSRHQASNLIAAVYGDRVTNLAPVDEKQELENMKNDLELWIIKNVILNPALTCGAIGSEPKNKTLFEATNWLQDPLNSNPCWCGIMTSYSESFYKWSVSRYKIAAIKEVNIALESSNPSTIIVAGGGHAFHSIKHMKARWISYQVVLPTGADTSLISIDKDPVEMENTRLKQALACKPAHSKKIPGFQSLVASSVERATAWSAALLKSLDAKK
jgi:hypothetical protein